MNRKGEDALDLNLVMVLKLVLTAAIIIGVVVMTYKLIGLFQSGGKDVRASHNLEMLSDRVKVLENSELGVTQTSVILDLPTDYRLYSFSDGQNERTVQVGRLDIGGTISNYIASFGSPTIGAVEFSSETLARPKSCRGACICAFKEEDDVTQGTEKKRTFRTIECTHVDTDTIDVAFAGGPYNFIVERSATGITSHLEVPANAKAVATQ